MSSSHILWPVLAQVFLTLVMYIVLATRKAGAVKAGLVNRQQASLDSRMWPENVVKVSNNIANQFEAPVLFYVLCLVIYNIGAVSMPALVLAWLFVVSRWAHAYVHVGSNYVPLRMRLFLFGCVLLLVMLGLVAWQLAMEIQGS